MGFEIDIGWLTILMFGSLALLLALGLPMAFCTGSLATIFLFLFGNSAILNMMPSRIFPFMTDYELSAVPLFIFMAAMLEKAGIIEELFDAVYKWLGSVKGGLAAATVLACTALAAMVGVVGATEVTMGMIALPAMLKRGYDQKLACGSLLAGGTLGILIPPSVMAIVYAVVAQQSLGELLVGSIFPGLLLSGLYVSYVLIRCYINPKLGPALPPDERVDWREKLRLLKNTIAPILLIILVLGVIFVGIATPVEAAGHRHLRRVVRLGVAPAADVAGGSGGGNCNVEGHRHGDVDFLRRHHVRRLLHREGRTDLRRQFDPRHRVAALRHSAADDGNPVRARHVHRLGRHPAADRADLSADHEEPAVGRRVRHSRRQAGGCAAVVWGHLHGQHADGVSQSAVRLFPVLSQERGAAGDHHGDDLPRGGEFHGAAMVGRRSLHRLSANCRLVAGPRLHAVDDAPRCGVRCGPGSRVE